MPWKRCSVHYESIFVHASDPLDGDLAVLCVLAIDILADDQLQDVAAILAYEVDQPEGERRLMT